MDELKDIGTFFHELRSSAGAIWADNGKIKFSAPKKFQNQETDIFISANKSKLMAILQDNDVTSSRKFLSTVIFKDCTLDSFPLSSAQERLWFIEQFEEGTNAYHLPSVLEVEEAADVAGLKHALQRVVERHEILRSTIEQREGQASAVQVVHHEPLVIEEVRLAANDNYKAVIKTDINRPFNLSKEYPLRVKFYFVYPGASIGGQPNRIFLLVNTHHIASDGWSLDIFQKELFAYYQAYCNRDDTFALPALEIQYKDYAAWQKCYLTNEVLERQLNYWRGRLEGYQPLKLSTDFIRPASIDYRGQHERFVIDRATSAKLRAMAQQYGVTLFSVMLGSIGVLLGKYSGQDDIVVGSPTANRHHQQTEGLIGFFVNTQANRMILDKAESFAGLIHRVYQDQVEAQAHQELPFEKLVGDLGVERDTSRHPIFQVMFSLQNFGKKHQAAGVQNNYLIPYKLEDGYEVEKFDLTILIDDGQEALQGEIGYATSLFHKDTIARLVKHYLNLLEQLASSPADQPYDQFNLLTAAETDQIVYGWNETEKYFPGENTIVQLFEEQAEQHPGKIALTCREQQLTYRELNERANQLARHIRAQYKARTRKDLAPDTRIALCVDRNVEMIVSIFAVLKAGAAYVPIDHRYPQERVDYILRDTGSDIILGQRHLGDIRLPADKLVYTDLTEDLYRHIDGHNLPQQSGPSNLAYVIYTSGTTGRPKGAMIEHRAFSQFIYNFNEYLSDKVKPGDCHVLSLTNYVFDIFGLEYALPLTTGNMMTLTSAETVTEKEIEGHQIVQQTPSSLLHFSKSFRHLLGDKVCLVGGESLSPFVAEYLVSAFGRVVNVYGPAEATIWTTACEVKDVNKISIGRPLMNEQVYVLDTGRRPVPVGTIGEIYIGGAGLARGYLNLTELTAERFVANPFATETDKAKGYTRLYKTGDMAKWLPDGNLEFIGRNDGQVKINGHRIELGEVEHAILQIVGVKQACVLVKERMTTTGTTKHLVAYYALEHNDGTLTPEVLQNRLVLVLPVYMIPAAWVSMPSFPLTFNGKLDKRAFPDPEFSSEAGYAAPATVIESDLCQLWMEILGIPRVGVTDDFFAIGGTSILAIQAASRMSKILRRNVKVADIFRLKSVSRIVEQLPVEFELVDRYQSAYNPDLSDLIFIHPGGGGSEVYQPLSEMLSRKFNCIGVDNYNIHYRKKIKSLSEIANYYLASLERKYTLRKPVYIMGWSLGGTIALEMAAILEARGIKKIHVILLDTLVQDEFMKTFITRKYVEDAMKQAQEELRDAALQGHDVAYVEKVNLAIDAEIEMMRSPLSGFLKHTSITLFKAMRVDMFKVLKDGKFKNEYVRMLPSNNVDLIANKVHVINLDCYHNDILQTNSETIGKYLLSSSYLNAVERKRLRAVSC